MQGQLIAAIEALAPRVSAILLSDYRSGLCTPAVVEAARQAARRGGLLLTADSQGQLDLYRDFALVKCNHNEAEAYLARRLPDDRALQNAAQELLERLSLAAMLITRGERGLTLASREAGVRHIPADNLTEVFDTTGAGDTVIAVATLALAGGLDVNSAALLANYAAGVAVRRLGNHPVTAAELAQVVAE